MQIGEIHQFIVAELLNLELKMNKRLEDVDERIQKQILALNDYIKTVEKNIKSYVDQQVETAKFELKTLIKEVENDIFKLKVWVMKQIELMNQAM